MASGLLQLGGVANLEGWKWLFLVDGIITVFVAVATWWMLLGLSLCFANLLVLQGSIFRVAWYIPKAVSEDSNLGLAIERSK